MPKPVITQPATPRTIAQGIAIPTLTLVATNDPDTWTAAPLPAGFSFDAEAGVITGTPTAAGLVSTTITATNESGTSDPVTIVWNVQAQPVGAGLWSDLELDMDLVERTVSIPGIERGEDEPVFKMGRGDKLFLLVGARKFGVLRDVNPASETVSLKLALKEFEPEILLTLQGGNPTKVGSADATRYRIPVWLDPADWAVLADYEDDKGTGMIPKAELEIVVGTPLYAETKLIDDLTLYADLGGADYGDPDAIEETLVFDGLTAIDGASYTLVVTLAVADRPGQNVSLTQTMTITFSGGLWVVSARTGDDSISGAIEEDEWRVTLGIEAVAGDANSVDVDVSIATSELSEGGILVWEIDARVTGDLEDTGSIIYVSPWRLRLFDGEGDEVGAPGAVIAEGYSSPETFLNAVNDAWGSLTGGGEATISIASANTLRFAVPRDSYDLQTIRIEHSTAPETGSTVGAIISPAAATLTGTLSQVATAEDQPPRFTAQFPIGVIRDMVPDSE